VELSRESGISTMQSNEILPWLVGLTLGVGYSSAGLAQGADPAPLIEQDDALQVSDHVYVILDDGRRYIPNVGIVIGDQATLVVDPGLGLTNGEIVLEEALKLSDNDKFYVVSTHYHSEHDLGAGAFPDDATMIRSNDQQADIEEFRLSHAQRLAQRTETLANLLEGAYFRPADAFFEDEYSVDLGGVTVHMYAVGPAHTRGDTVFFVEEDRVLFAGDVAMRRYPRLASPSSGVAVWLEALAALQPLDVGVLVPSHGPLSDAATIDAYQAYFATIQSRVGELVGQGVSADEIVEQLTAELAPTLSDWQEDGTAIIDATVRTAIDEAPQAGVGATLMPASH